MSKSGRGVNPTPGLIFRVCEWAWLGFQAAFMLAFPTRTNNETRMSSLSVGIFEGPGSLGTSSCPPPCFLPWSSPLGSHGAGRFCALL